MRNVRVNFLGIKNFLLKRKIKKLFLTALQLCNIQENVVVNVGFVSDLAIQKLNKQHRNVDKVTDVLSFPFFNMVNGVGLKQEMQKNSQEMFFGDFVELGDIVICESVVKKQAIEYGHSFTREVCFLATHGFLHLLGFDHIEKSDEKIMNSVAEKALEICKIKRKK